MRVRWISEDAALAVEQEARSFDFATNRRRLNPVQRVGDIGRRSFGGNMVENEDRPPGLSAA